MVGLSFHRLTPTPWTGRHEEVADGLHSVQEPIAALMCQTNGRWEEMGWERWVQVRGLALHCSGSDGPWCSKALRKQDQPLTSEMPTEAAHLSVLVTDNTMPKLDAQPAPYPLQQMVCQRPVSFI